MDNLKMIWVPSDLVKAEHDNFPLKQVYVWLILEEKKIVLVSKDGENWQLPGGKPEKDESIIETAVREVKEETGLDISNYRTDLNFFGYYVVENTVTHEKIIQVRLYIKTVTNLSEDKLSLYYENRSQSEEDIIKHTKLTTFNNATKLIPWLGKSGEYKSLINLGIIKND